MKSREISTDLKSFRRVSRAVWSRTERSLTQFAPSIDYDAAAAAASDHDAGEVEADDAILQIGHNVRGPPQQIR